MLHDHPMTEPSSPLLAGWASEPFTNAGITHDLYTRGSGPGVVTVRVADDGAGIPRHLADRVFLPHERGVATAAGAGLGLAIARSVAELHGGRLELVHSTPAGSEFAALLPNDPPTPAIQ